MGRSFQADVSIRAAEVKKDHKHFHLVKSVPSSKHYRHQRYQGTVRSEARLFLAIQKRTRPIAKISQPNPTRLLQRLRPLVPELPRAARTTEANKNWQEK